MLPKNMTRPLKNYLVNLPAQILEIEMSCEECDFYDYDTEKCWRDPANPKEITQEDANCDWDTSED